MSETPQESFSVPFRQPHHAPSTQQGGDPAEDIESLAMLARGGDTKPLSFLGPTHPNTRMQGEARLVLENNRLIRSQSPEFFLTPCGISSCPWLVPEDRNNSPVSGDTPIDASSTVPGEPSALSQSDVSGERQGSDHPIGPDLAPARKGASPNPLPVPDEPRGLNARGGPAFSSAVTPLPPPRLPCGSRRSGFDASDPRSRRSIPDADPPMSATQPLSSFPYRPRELSEPGSKDALGLPPDGLKSMLAFSCSKRIMRSPICQVISCVRNNPPRAGQRGKSSLPFGDYDPCLSHDGRKVVFERLEDDASPHGNYDIYVIAVDGSRETRLTNNGYTQGLANWSHSGDKVVYLVSAMGKVRKYNIYMMNSDGRKNRNITSNYFPAAFLCHSSVFSKDDSKIFFVGEWWE